MNEESKELVPDVLVKKKSAVRYWERRRWIYLALLVPAAVVGYFLAGEVLAGFDDKEVVSTFAILMMFTVAFINANIAYSFAYVFEFGFIGTSRHDGYSRAWRPRLFAAGCILGMILAFGVSRGIAFAKYAPI